jgi:hypothetical protein
VLSDDFLLRHALRPLDGLDDGPLHDALRHASNERIVATPRLSFIVQDDLLTAVNAGQASNEASGNGPAGRWTTKGLHGQPAHLATIGPGLFKYVRGAGDLVRGEALLSPVRRPQPTAALTPRAAA